MADSRISLYHNLSVMLSAGVSVTRALRTAHQGGSYGRLFQEIEKQVAAGQSISDVIQQHPRQFGKLDRTLIQVGEETGLIAEMFEMLSQWYDFRQRLRRTIQSGLIFPILLIHALALIAPVVPFALGGFDWTIYLKGMLGIVALFYIPAAVVLMILFLTPKQGPLRWLLDSVILKIPLVGKAIRELELGRYAKVFSMTYKAGVPIVRCARMATDSVTNSVMQKQLAGGLECADQGREMSLGFSQSLPAEFLSLWQVGEESGELDNSSARLADLHAENAEMRFRLISQWTPKLVYGIVCLVMAYYVFKGYSQIYGNLYM